MSTLSDLIDAAAHRMANPYQTDPTNANKLGWSKIETWLQCGRRYYYQYIAREDREPNISGTFGSVVHETIAAGHRMHWGVGQAGVAGEFLLNLWEQVAPESHPRRPEYDRLAQTAVDDWVPWYLSWSSKSITVATEERWSVDLEIAGRTVEMQGTWDRLYLTPEGGTVVSDVKTGGNIAPLDSSGQLSLYSWAYRATTGEQESALELLKLRAKGTSDDPRPLRTTRTDEYLADFIANTVLPVVQAITQGIFPCNPDGKYGCGFCGYQHLCPVGGDIADAD